MSVRASATLFAEIYRPRDDPRPLLEEVSDCQSWALTTYDRCEYRCVYCITGMQGESTPRVPRSEVAPRLRAELAEIAPDAHVSVGSISDAYPPIEEQQEVTRAAIAELVALRRRFTVITKGALVLRDTDLFAEASAIVRVSLCSVDEHAIRRVDPKAPSVEERLSVVRALADADLNVAVNAEPWIPGTSDVASLLARVPEGVPVRVAPLNVVSPLVAATPYGRRFSQRAINEAYFREFKRVGPRPNVIWVRPIRVDDSEPEYPPFARLGARDLCVGEYDEPD